MEAFDFTVRKTVRRGDLFHGKWRGLQRAGAGFSPLKLAYAL